MQRIVVRRSCWIAGTAFASIATAKRGISVCGRCSVATGFRGAATACRLATRRNTHPARAQRPRPRRPRKFRRLQPKRRRPRRRRRPPRPLQRRPRRLLKRRRLRLQRLVPKPAGVTRLTDDQIFAGTLSRLFFCAGFARVGASTAVSYAAHDQLQSSRRRGTRFPFACEPRNCCTSLSRSASVSCAW